jgi:hypothetical protein
MAKPSSKEKKKPLPKEDKMNQSIMKQYSNISPKLLQKKNKPIEKKENKSIIGKNSAQKESEHNTQLELKTVKKSKIKEKQVGRIAIKTLHEKSPEKDYEYNDDFEETSVKADKKVLKVIKSKPATKQVVVKFKINGNVKKGTGRVTIGGKKNDYPSPMTEKPVSQKQ